jgi:hypothetical protein
MLIRGVDSSLWAKAIAVRVADEWNSDFVEDRDILINALEVSLNKSLESIKSLIGTGVIEENYFEALD